MAENQHIFIHFYAYFCTKRQAAEGISAAFVYCKCRIIFDFRLCLAVKYHIFAEMLLFFRVLKLFTQDLFYFIYLVLR